MPRTATVLAAALIALFTMAGALAACTRDVTSTEPEALTAEGQSTVAYARDGSLAFEVNAVEQRDTVGDPASPGESITAKGVFIVVSLRIRNVGTEPVTFVDSDQTLVDVTGQSFPTDRAANIYGNRDVPSTRMAPGQELRVRIAFDVPPGTQAREIVLRESAASPGVVVALG